MKKLAIAAALVATLGAAIPAPRAEAQVSISVSLGSFYDELSPYGSWVECRWGECWVPRGVPDDWQPYSNGHWIYTVYGWTWVSDDPWGSDPYHFGAWDFVGRWGWVWVPGTVWAPAWVTWSYSDRYVGWAPMPPTATFGSSGYSGRPVVVSESRYVFVPSSRFVGANVRSAREAPRLNAEILRQATPATRFDVSGGIVRNVGVPLAAVQQATPRRIETREIGLARTSPRSLSPTGGLSPAPVSIVAPRSEIEARATRSVPEPRPAPEQHASQRPPEIPYRERATPRERPPEPQGFSPRPRSTPSPNSDRSLRSSPDPRFSRSRRSPRGGRLRPEARRERSTRR